MSDDLWADQGGQRRKRRLRKGKERKDGTEGRRCGCLEDVSVYNNSITTNFFAAFVEEKTTNKISK